MQAKTNNITPSFARWAKGHDWFHALTFKNGIPTIIGYQSETDSLVSFTNKQALLDWAGY